MNRTRLLSVLLSWTGWFVWVLSLTAVNIWSCESCFYWYTSWKIWLMISIGYLLTNIGAGLHLSEE